MSLAIDCEKVIGVMVQGQWFDVAPGSFVLDAYEFVEEYEDEDAHGKAHRETILLGGTVPGISSMGCAWTGTDKLHYACPFPNVQLIRTGKPRK